MTAAPRKKVRELVTGDYRALEAEFLSCVRGLRRADALSPIVVIVTSKLLGLHLRRHLAENGLPHINIRFLTLEALAQQIAEPVIRREGRTQMPAIAPARAMAETLRSVASDTADFYFSAIIDRPGFHDAMLATIRDLEEAALAPDDLRGAIKQQRVRKAVHLKKLEDLTTVWHRYRRLLDDLAWVDDYKVMLSAVEHLREAPLVRGARSFLVYGFYDLNALQRKMLDACIEVNDTVAFMPFEDTRAYDFARPTLRWMESRGFRVRPAAAPLDDGASPILAHLRKHIFVDAAEAPQPQDAVTFVSAPGEVREVREIVRGIADEVRRHDFKSHEVGILLRDPSTYSSILRETFDRLGMEPYVPEGRPLSETVDGRSILLLLEVLAHNYARSERAPATSSHCHPWS